MLHTPPVKANWQSETALVSSYEGESNDSADNTIMLSDEEDTSGPTSLSTQDVENLINDSMDASEVTEDLNRFIESNRTLDNNTTIQSGSSSFIESSVIPSQDDLPETLQRSYQSFIQELKEPKFDRSLASFEVAEMFQSFYRRFHSDCELHVQSEDDSNTYSFYKYNLTLERLLCDKFYSQIIFPLKSIQIDDFESKLNDDFNDKLGCISSLDIHFSNLDIDLPQEIENDFIDQLNDKVLPEFELFTAERSPTLKMKYLIKIHKKIAQIVASLTSTKDIALNTDIYLPLLIFTIIKLDELRAYFLTRQLFFIKRFSNEFIFSQSSDSLEIEKGKLLYVLANFEASISYLASVTLENLNIATPPEDVKLMSGSTRSREDLLDLLKTPIQLETVDEKVAEFKDFHPLAMNEQYKDLSLNPFNNWIDYTNVSIPNAVITADQGIKSISQTIDVSLRDILDKVTFFSNPTISTKPLDQDTKEESKLSDMLLKQLEENDAFEKQMKNTLSPMTSKEKSETRDKEDGIISKFTVSMGGVMKNFRAVSASSSTTSLNVQLEETATPGVGKTANNIRSRATSFMNNHNTIFGSPNNPLLESSQSQNSVSNPHINMQSPSRENRSSLSIFSSIENAFDNVRNNRSRNNSIQTHQQTAPQLTNATTTFEPLTKPFEEMNVQELRDMYARYQALAALHRAG